MLIMIKELTTDPKTSLGKNSNAVVVFVTTWCDDCKRSLEFENTLAEKFKGEITFYRMNAEKYEGIADNYDVANYPTFVFFKKGILCENPLVEPLSEIEIKKWIEKNLA